MSNDKNKGIEVIPSAKRLIKSLRDMGYDFGQAVADIVDNSIEAGATRIDIQAEFDGDESWVRIADNGRGMRNDQLQEAMRYGAARSYTEDDLGRFGLGLKTASMSQCQRLSVASRNDPDRIVLSAFCWDLDHIETTNRWEILPVKGSDLGPILRSPLKDSTGTVVLWQRLDRILGYRHPYGDAARKRLSLMCRQTEEHLAMVFHRFLMGEVRGKRIRIYLNGNEVKPWDPFCRKEPKTKALDSARIRVEYEGSVGDILLEPFVLPHQDDFSSPDAFRLASGPANWNQQQGFYIYRADRMIQSGGWSNFFAPDEHMKLARIAVSFSPTLDEAFKINVAKMRVQMPTQARDEVREAVGAVRKQAKQAYDRKEPGYQPKGQGASFTADGPRTTAAGNTAARGAAKKIDPRQLLLPFEDFSQHLLASATVQERPIVERVLRRARDRLQG